MWLGKGCNLTSFIKYSPWFFLVNILFDVSNFGTIYFSYNIFFIQIKPSLPKKIIKKSNENVSGKYDVAIYRWKLQRRSYICNFLWKQRWNKKDDVCYSVGIFICHIVDGISIGNFKSN